MEDRHVATSHSHPVPMQRNAQATLRRCDVGGESSHNNLGEAISERARGNSLFSARWRFSVTPLAMDGGEPVLLGRFKSIGKHTVVAHEQKALHFSILMLATLM